MTTTRRRGAEEARNRLPDLLDEAENGRATIITRHGKAVAALVPIKTYENSQPQLPLGPLKGMARGYWGKDSRATVRKLRDEWDR